MDALTLLQQRRSCASLQAPAPDGEALEAVLKAALRVPDFLGLHPYEFLVATGAGLVRLGEAMQRAAKASERPSAVVERAASMPLRAPMVIVVVCRHRPHDVVAPLEQQLSAGCAAYTLLLAATAQGFNGIWRSGWPMFDRNLHAELGLGDKDQIVGFLYLGTPKDVPSIEERAVARPENYVRYL